MKIYIGSEGKRRRLDKMKQLGLRMLVNPQTCYGERLTFPFIYDNGAFSSYVNNIDFDVYAFLKGLNKIKNNQNLQFAVIPDKVAQGKLSLKYSLLWRIFLPNEIDWYLAIQDGMYVKHIKKEDLINIKGLFIGGTRDWKYRNAKEWVEFAHNNNLQVHIGRIGTFKLLEWSDRIGADSIDSSNFAQNECNWNDLMKYLDNGGNLQIELHT